MGDAEKTLTEEGHALMGAAFEVDRTLSGGLLEECLINFGPIRSLPRKRFLLSEFFSD